MSEKQAERSDFHDYFRFFFILVGIPTSNIVNTGRESHIYYLEELWQAGAD